MSGDNDLLDQLDAFSDNPEQAMNDVVFENYKRIIEDDTYRDQVVKKCKKHRHGKNKN